ncbi:MAG TPA: hypothetical protein VFX70_08845 [Mycobacteriales bacterium]|nr:hypothetical protein [Mycobacteriales bacterium]
MTISLPEELVEHLGELARHSGVPVSSWIAHAAREQARIQDGLEALREWEEESGPLTPEEMADARAAFAQADAAMIRSSRRAG